MAWFISRVNGAEEKTMLGIGVEIALWGWWVALRFHPLRWDRLDSWKSQSGFGLVRLGPFTFEWDVGHYIRGKD